MMLRVIGGVAIPMPDSDPPSGRWCRAVALLYMGLYSARVARAALVTIACGYAPEAMAFKRIILELHTRAQEVIKDQSGEKARQWIGERPQKASAGLEPLDLWRNLSHSAHADPLHITTFLAISEDDGTRLVTLPERRAEIDNVTLAMFAGEVRDIAVMIAEKRGVSVVGLEELTAEIQANWPWDDSEEEC